jgi:hypothetical protein
MTNGILGISCCFSAAFVSACSCVSC